mmetsp:Transcript_8635/g.14875  ORF Transcript_8635/g.14875 Transcript_8635/m.14875 type:complete len:91 (-) Transcript_8635:327-599(-)
MSDRPAMEEDMFAPNPKSRNPLVLVGALVTAGVLTAGLVAFKQGNTMRSQQMMRARIVAQGATVAVLVASSGVGVLGFGKGTATTEAVEK